MLQLCFLENKVMDFSLSPLGQEYTSRINAFLADKILPAEAEYESEVRSMSRWTPESRWQSPSIMLKLREEAKAQGLWNLFLPQESSLNTQEYATVAEIMGRSFMAAEVFNCNAPDTGNMEVFAHYGNEAQKKTWLTPLLAGEIHSAFCMTEPDVASSDATNIEASAIIDGDNVILNGKKWWSTGVGHADCKVLLVMARTFEDGPRHQQHSIVVVPMNTPGVQVTRMLDVFGDQDAPLGHGEVVFENVCLKTSDFILGAGRGFEVAQGRLGPGRIHHCMRAIGAAERALEMLLARANEREAFGKPLYKLGGNVDVIANARIAIEQARLLTLKTAWLIDNHGIKKALSEVSQIKVVVPNMLQQIVDQAIQIFGAAGVCDDWALASLYRYARVLRIADGPDEVHRQQITKYEIKKWQKRHSL